MRKVIIVTLIAFALSHACFADEKDVLQKAAEFVSQKNPLEALRIVERGIEEFGETEALLRANYSILFRLERFEEALAMVEKRIRLFGETQNLIEAKYTVLLRLERLEEALEVIEKGIREVGESPFFLQEKFYLLMELGRFEEALNTAMRNEKSSRTNSAESAIDIAKAYLKLNDMKRAIDWFEQAVERGFVSYSDPYVEEFTVIQGEKRLDKLLKRIKDSLGVGKQVKDFTVMLVSGARFQISQQKRKVILIDFWATWCAPCMAEIPHLKDYYEEFKDKGFEIVGISLDKDKAIAEQYIKNENVRWKIACSGKGWNDGTALKFGVDEIPCYWLVDKKGILREYGLRGEKLRKAIKELLSE